MKLRFGFVLCVMLCVIGFASAFQPPPISKEEDEAIVARETMNTSKSAAVAQNKGATTAFNAMDLSRDTYVDCYNKYKPWPQAVDDAATKLFNDGELDYDFGKYYFDEGATTWDKGLGFEQEGDAYYAKANYVAAKASYVAASLAYDECANNNYYAAGYFTTAKSSYDAALDVLIAELTK